MPDLSGHFAIYRTEKITHGGSLAASAQHMARTRPTPNADPERAPKNRILVGTDDPEADVLALLPKVGERDERGQLRRRTNSVLAIEVMLTASPEWWSSSTPEQRRTWLDTSVEWLVAQYGRENIAHLRLHQDETNPHLTGFVVPLDPETGHLNARRWVGGRKRLADQQTSYAEAVEPLGLRRGIEGSQAKHERVQRFYGALAQPTVEIDVQAPPRILWDREGWAAQQAEKAAQAVAPVAARAATAEMERTRRKGAEASQKAAQGRAERAEAATAKAEEAVAKAKAEAKELADEMRSLPLTKVLDRLGFEVSDRDPAKWKLDEMRISVGEGTKAAKWFDHVGDIGGGGAIDLVRHAKGVDFKSALAWLAAAFGPGEAEADLAAQMIRQAKEAVREAVAERPPFTAPAPAPEHWPRVRGWLIGRRALPADAVDRLHDAGEVYADARRNAVFVCRDEAGTVVGAELKGTITRRDGSRWSGMAVGSLKARGEFRLGELARAATVYLVESAVDAISLAALRWKAGEAGFAIVSTAGTAARGRPFMDRLGDAVRRVCAYDADGPGEKAGETLAAAGWERLRPEGKDWNDDLRALVETEGMEGSADASPSSDDTPELT
jgi:hypothetical protein